MSFGAFAPLPLRLKNSGSGISAAQHARICADMVALVGAVEFAVLVVDTGTPAVLSYMGQHGFEPPTIALVGGSSGHISITWDRAYADDFGSAAATNITRAEVTAGNTSLFHATVEVTSSFSVKVHTKNRLNAYSGTVCTLVVY